ncbi:SGNH/GDSL hydrolase family protein [Variovorax sp. J2P1-59]|uniref:SGNH/GDSL hydrolase family protein n=1 Tax=Variovorax flavidus TaxID=3053501 RepID=UPI002576A29A|nr:SGNH/GDSL hydrolase family protein [Variovorax sp. J2P1-59]MDM0074551.1 SGNH/GDSL hydrolase family protein [Variovorax sp. J2P1-59]
MFRKKFPLVRHGGAALLALALSACGGKSADTPVTGAVPATPGVVAAARPMPDKTSADCSVVFYGDSILNGSYVKEELSMRHARHPAAELKAQRPAWRIDDRTVPGQSLAKVAKGFHGDPRDARVVVIESGIAEGWSGGTVLTHLPWMIEAVRFEGKIPVLTGYSRQTPNAFMTPDKLAGRDRIDDEAKRLARDMDVEFADFGSAGPAELIDDVHPTQEYSLRLTAKLIEALDRVAPECSHH